MTTCMICNKQVILPVTNNVFICHNEYSCLTCFRDYLGLNKVINPYGHYIFKCPKCPNTHHVPIMNASTYKLDEKLIKGLDNKGCVNCPRCSTSIDNQSKLLVHIRTSCPKRTISCTMCYKNHTADFNCITPPRNKTIIPTNPNCKIVPCTVCRNKFPEYSAWEQTDGSWKCHKCHTF